MIATIHTDNVRHAGQVQFVAMLHGLDTERMDDNHVDVVYHDDLKLFRVIQRAGGQLVAIVDKVPR